MDTYNLSSSEIDLPEKSTGSILQRFVLVGGDADKGHLPKIDLTDDDINSKISRNHSKISFENEGYFIEDLGSLNGTFINQGNRLVQGQKAPLNHGDELIMGKLFFRFEVRRTVKMEAC
jgi:predicted component of type VI protein secretion system